MVIYVAIASVFLISILCTIHEIVKRRMDYNANMRSYVPDEERRELEVQIIMSQLKVVDFTQYKQQF